MADDTEALLAELRKQLSEAGYVGLLAEDEVASGYLERTPDAVLEDLLDALQDGVVPAMRARVAATRILAQSSTATGYPPPAEEFPLSSDREGAPEDLSYALDVEIANELERDADALSDLVDELRVRIRADQV